MGVTIADEQLKRVSDLSMKLVEQQDLVKAAEERLAEAKKRMFEIEMQELPELMSEFGIEHLTLADGSSIAVKTVYGATIKKDNEPAAFDWLRDNGYGDIIKERVVTNVHPSTLKAWVKERVESGDEVPEQLFGVFVGRKAYVK